VAEEAPLDHRLLVGFQDDPSFRWRPDRRATLDAAQAAGTSVIRTTLEWAQVAPERPRRASDPFDPAYRLDDVDELVRNAQARGIEPMLTIWGTPPWANGGRARNIPPSRPQDLEAFAEAVASRYSGRHAGYPFVRYFSVWNEPNLEQFLAPQFAADGGSLSPALYARLFRVAHRGVKAGNPRALVAAGETSARGRDRPSGGAAQDSHSPGRFARLLSEVAPDLRFDAWAHHPYPTEPRLPPQARARWPNVNLLGLPRFGRELEGWFGRPLPLWVTEYGHETRPGEPRGVSQLEQARYAEEALALVGANAQVEMFVWFTFRDDSGNPWQSGLIGRAGQPKSALARFGAAARGLDARISLDETGLLRLSALELAYYAGPGAAVSVDLRLGGRALETRASALGPDGWLTLHVPALANGRGSLRVGVRDPYGNRIVRSLDLEARGKVVTP